MKVFLRILGTLFNIFAFLFVVGIVIAVIYNFAFVKLFSLPVMNVWQGMGVGAIMFIDGIIKAMLIAKGELK